jgi:hypothetical protein
MTQVKESTPDPELLDLWQRLEPQQQDMVRFILRSLTAEEAQTVAHSRADARARTQMLKSHLETYLSELQSGQGEEATPSGLAYAIASEEVLARDWLSPEDEAAWRDL